jgi:hypothetical protein
MGFAVADQWDKKTTITIDEPVQLPGTTLQPGTYVIKLVDLGANRHTVQFFEKDEKHIVTTILAIPNERVRPTGKSVFAFWETPAGEPKALRAWFYPGDNFGQEFAYPKEEATRISARNNNVTVPIIDEKEKDQKTEASTQSTTTAVTATEPAPAPVAVAEPSPAPAPAPAPVEVAAAQQPVPATVDTSSDAQRVTAPPPAETLPRTASNLPLLTLIGMLSMLAALALRFAYNRN